MGKITNWIVAGNQERSSLDRGGKGFSNFVECDWMGSEYTGFSPILRDDTTILLIQDAETEAKGSK